MSSVSIESETSSSTDQGASGQSREPILSLGSAKLLACKKWSAGTAGVVGHRVGFAVLRRKNVVKRYEVGYRTLVSLTPEHWVERFLGNGTSWEQAFAEAQAELGVPW